MTQKLLPFLFFLVIPCSSSATQTEQSLAKKEYRGHTIEYNKNPIVWYMLESEKGKESLDRFSMSTVTNIESELVLLIFAFVLCMTLTRSTNERNYKKAVKKSLKEVEESIDEAIDNFIIELNENGWEKWQIKGKNRGIFHDSNFIKNLPIQRRERKNTIKLEREKNMIALDIEELQKRRKLFKKTQQKMLEEALNKAQDQRLLEFIMSYLIVKGFHNTLNILLNSPEDKRVPVLLISLWGFTFLYICIEKHLETQELNTEKFIKILVQAIINKLHIGLLAVFFIFSDLREKDGLLKEVFVALLSICSIVGSMLFWENSDEQFSIQIQKIAFQKYQAIHSQAEKKLKEEEKNQPISY